MMLGTVVFSSISQYFMCTTRISSTIIGRKYNPKECYPNVGLPDMDSDLVGP